MWLNIGVGVVPELSARVFFGEINDDGRRDPPTVHMNVSYRRDWGHYVADFVGYEGEDVSSADLRTVKVGELLKIVVARGIFLKLEKDDPPASLTDWWGESGEPMIVGSKLEERAKAAGPEDWVLALVAQSYQLARISSQPPAKAVERHLGLPARTAVRWIAKARAKGLLPTPAIPGDEELVDMHERMREQIADGTFGVLTARPGESLDDFLERAKRGKHQAKA